jgi:hypothetical protein
MNPIKFAGTITFPYIKELWPDQVKRASQLSDSTQAFKNERFKLATVDFKDTDTFDRQFLKSLIDEGIEGDEICYFPHAESPELPASYFEARLTQKLASLEA